MAAGLLSIFGAQGTDKVRVNIDSNAGQFVLINNQFIAQNNLNLHSNVVHLSSVEERRIFHNTN